MSILTHLIKLAHSASIRNKRQEDKKLCIINMKILVLKLNYDLVSYVVMANF